MGNPAAERVLKKHNTYPVLLKEWTLFRRFQSYYVLFVNAENSVSQAFPAGPPRKEQRDSQPRGVRPLPQEQHPRRAAVRGCHGVRRSEAGTVDSPLRKKIGEAGRGPRWRRQAAPGLEKRAGGEAGARAATRGPLRKRPGRITASRHGPGIACFRGRTRNRKNMPPGKTRPPRDPPFLLPPPRASGENSR